MFALIFLLQNVSTVFAFNFGKLREDLAAAQIQSVFPQDETYPNVTTPCPVSRLRIEQTLTIRADNLRFAFQPAAIAYPISTDQVSSAVSIAASQGLPVVARSGGHSYVDNSLGGGDGSFVIDMAAFKEITVHEDGTATLGVANKLGDVVIGLNEYGRAIPHGRCTYVGLGGHSAFGGYGLTSRMWGLTIDAVKSVEAVLSNGTVVTASQEEKPDLFWGIRGSASSFAITTLVTVDTHPVPASVAYATYVWDSMDIASATHTLALFQDYADSDISPELGTEIFLTAGSTSGTVSIQYIAAWFGAVEDYNATVDPFLGALTEPSSSTWVDGNWIEGFEALAYPSLDTSAPNAYATFYTKSLMTPEGEPMTRDALEAFVTYLATIVPPSELTWIVEVELYGGSNSAMNAIPVNNTSFAHRDTKFNLQISGYNAAPPFPKEGYTFVQGITSSIIDNMPEDWNWASYTNYVEDRLHDYASHFFRMTAKKDLLCKRAVQILRRPLYGSSKPQGKPRSTKHLQVSNFNRIVMLSGINCG
ncbi:Glucooligosaccharide oxidase [Cylindrobasidium torrendii FP15055 ss-10]|uniref:Glucooligosaccharide oxidase n=1 Tax=Cylindrobasidium torrendii FP15055 ss-10 TaxID=1314674 RepID=A0A0D7BKB7_9AGAR|nr:Glucooligosaccharide oxidase [Cylindrobasidium torrendii FP15055 ss-10]